LFGYSVSWAFTSIGLALKEPEAATLMALGPPVFLTFASSAIVPVETMPGWLQVFARNQPASVTINTVRALMEGGAVAHWLWQSAAWSAALMAVFVALAIKQYD